MKKILKLVYAEGEQAICFAMFLVMLIILFLQVVLRFIFSHSNMWSEELSRYLFIYIVFMASSFAVTQRAHIRIDVLEKIWPRPLRKPTAVLGEIIWIAFSVLLTVLSAKYVYLNVAKLHQMSLGIKVPMAWFWTALPIGNAAISFRLVLAFIEDYIMHRKLVKIDDKPETEEGKEEKA